MSLIILFSATEISIPSIFTLNDTCRPALLVYYYYYYYYYPTLLLNYPNVSFLTLEFIIYYACFFLIIGYVNDGSYFLQNSNAFSLSLASLLSIYTFFSSSFSKQNYLISNICANELAFSYRFMNSYLGRGGDFLVIYLVINIFLQISSLMILSMWRNFIY